MLTPKKCQKLLLPSQKMPTPKTSSSKSRSASGVTDSPRSIRRQDAYAN
jgi:hypothetical protein